MGNIRDEVSLSEYLKSFVRNSTRSERVACAVVMLSLAVCILLVIYFTVIANNRDIVLDIDTAPHEWNITRQMWLAQPYDDIEATSSSPLRLVIINHSAGNECGRFVNCAAELRNLQGYFLNKLHYDIPFNFMLGNDGRVYEGRGWGVVGAHTISYNRCSLGIGYLGDYRPDTMNTQATASQVNRTFKLLNYGVKHGYLHPDYVIVGGRDLYPKESPGINLYRLMKTWDHYNKDRYHGMTCEQIHFGINSTTTAVAPAG